jgi:integrase
VAIYKRGKTWHTDFSVNGLRFRQSLDTSDWREAQAKEKELIAQASAGKLAPVSTQFSRLRFAEAAERYLQSRQLELSESSIKKERQLLVKPRRFFGAQTLKKMTTENLVDFREWRNQAGVGHAIINMEMGVIRRILKRAKRWHVIAADFKPLREPRGSIGRALSFAEKAKLLHASRQNPGWMNARLAMVLALNTTMRGCEIKSLRWRYVDLMSRTFTIIKSKTDAGERVIPMNAEAYGAVLALRERAKRTGGLESDHFVFPACENGKIDPTRPQRSWRSAWRELTKAAGLKGLRFHDLRHHAITELSESQASDSTIMSIAGHVSPKMLAHYSHVRLEAKRKALDGLSGRGKTDSYDTNHDTNSELEGLPSPEVVERYGRHEETRTPDLYRVKVAL